MIRPCTEDEFQQLFTIINDAAEAYRGVIPEDRWSEPYISAEELRHEIDAGVRFWGYELDGLLVGVMGIQDVRDVTLIRHAYVRTAARRKGIGSRILAHLKTLTERPMLVGICLVATPRNDGTRLLSGLGRRRSCWRCSIGKKRVI